MRAGLEMWLVKKKHTHTTARERRWSKSPKKKRVDLYHSLGFMFMAVFHFSQRVCVCECACVCVCVCVCVSLTLEIKFSGLSEFANITMVLSHS